MNTTALISRITDLLSMTSNATYPMRKLLSEFPLQLPPLRADRSDPAGQAACALQVCEELGHTLIPVARVRSGFVHVELRLKTGAIASTVQLREVLQGLRQTLIRFERVRKLFPSNRTDIQELALYGSAERKRAVNEGLLALLQHEAVDPNEDLLIELGALFEIPQRTRFLQAA